MYTEGEFDLGKANALTIPQNSVVMRDGYAYVYKIGKENRVAQIKVVTGRRQGDRIEVLSGLTADAQIVAGGAGFLNDGDKVRIVVDKPKAASIMPLELKSRS